MRWLKYLFHFHRYKHVKYINEWNEARCTESLEECSCGKRRIKCEYWEAVGTSYFYHKEYNPRYL